MVSLICCALKLWYFFADVLVRQHRADHRSTADEGQRRQLVQHGAHVNGGTLIPNLGLVIFPDLKNMPDLETHLSLAFYVTDILSKKNCATEK